MSNRIVDNFEVSLLLSRVHEMRLIRLNEGPDGEFRYRVNANITTQATLGISPTAPETLVILGKLSLEARFVADTGTDLGGTPYAEVQLSVDGAFTTSLSKSEIADDPRLGTNAMSNVSQALVSVADVHLRQMITMASLPFVIPPDKLQELARQSQPVAVPA